MTEPTDPTTAADVDPRTAADAAEAVECVQTYLNGFDRVAKAQGGQDYVFSPEDIVLADAMRTLLADRVRLEAELEQAKRTLTMPILRQAWRNGWSDRARAVRDAVRVSDNDRDAYERAFARYMSEDPAEADKDPYRPLDGPDDPAAEKGPQSHAETPAPSPHPTPEGRSAHRGS